MDYFTVINDTEGEREAWTFAADELDQHVEPRVLGAGPRRFGFPSAVRGTSRVG